MKQKEIVMGTRTCCFVLSIVIGMALSAHARSAVEFKYKDKDGQEHVHRGLFDDDVDLSDIAGKTIRNVTAVGVGVHYLDPLNSYHLWSWLLRYLYLFHLVMGKLCDSLNRLYSGLVQSIHLFLV